MRSAFSPLHYCTVLVILLAGTLFVLFGGRTVGPANCTSYYYRAYPVYNNAIKPSCPREGSVEDCHHVHEAWRRPFRGGDGPAA